MTETIRIGGVGKLWMPVPRDWDGIGMANVEIVSIFPAPDDIYKDVQGNLIAYWDVGYRSSTEFSIVFELDLAPIDYQIDPNALGVYDVSSLEYQRYIQESEWIQSSDDRIVQLAREIVGTETNPYRQAQLVHRWVSTKIEGGGPTDALTTLQNQAGDCSGHSWLFIALLRALGIPSRGVGGLHTAYQGEFHDGDSRSNTLYLHI